MDSPEEKAAGKFFSIICLFVLFFVLILNSKVENWLQKGIFNTSLHIHFVITGLSYIFGFQNSIA